MRNLQENEQKKIKEEKKKEQYNVIKTYSKNGETFQNVMEKILLNKFNNM